MSFSLDAGALEAGLGTMLITDLAPFIRGGAADLRDFGLAIAADFTRAILAGNKALTDQLRGQVRLLVEISRIRIEVVDWKLTEDALALIFKAVAVGVGGFIPKP